MTDHDTYINVCKNALINEQVFDTFKQNPNFCYTFEQEHPNPDLFAYICTEYLIKYHKDLLNQLPWPKYQENDLVGNPKRENCIKLKEHVQLLSYYFPIQHYDIFLQVSIYSTILLVNLLKYLIN